MRSGLGPAYSQWRPGTARSVANQKGEQVWGRFEHVRLDRSQGVPSTNPIFVGSVSTQEVVNEALGDLLRVTAVTFEDGAVNRPHRHTTDQVLIATSGSGFVATDDEYYSLEPGDVAFVPAGTRHWHGANPDRHLHPLSILTSGHTKIDDDDPRSFSRPPRRFAYMRLNVFPLPDSPGHGKTGAIPPKTPRKRCHWGCCGRGGRVPECGYPPQIVAAAMDRRGGAR